MLIVIPGTSIAHEERKSLPGMYEGSFTDLKIGAIARSSADGLNIRLISDTYSEGGDLLEDTGGESDFVVVEEPEWVVFDGFGARTNMFNQAIGSGVHTYVTQIYLFIKQEILEAGIKGHEGEPVDINLHAFSRGAATSLLLVGLFEEEIRAGRIKFNVIANDPVPGPGLSDYFSKTNGIDRLKRELNRRLTIRRVSSPRNGQPSSVTRDRLFAQDSDQDQHRNLWHLLSDLQETGNVKLKMTYMTREVRPGFEHALDYDPNLADEREEHMYSTSINTIMQMIEQGSFILLPGRHAAADDEKEDQHLGAVRNILCSTIHGQLMKDGYKLTETGYSKIHEQSIQHAEDYWRLIAQDRDFSDQFGRSQVVRQGKRNHRYLYYRAIQQLIGKQSGESAAEMASIEAAIHSPEEILANTLFAPFHDKAAMMSQLAEVCPAFIQGLRNGDRKLSIEETSKLYLQRPFITGFLIRTGFIEPLSPKCHVLYSLIHLANTVYPKYQELIAAVEGKPDSENLQYKKDYIEALYDDLNRAIRYFSLEDPSLSEDMFGQEEPDMQWIKYRMMSFNFIPQEVTAPRSTFFQAAGLSSDTEHLTSRLNHIVKAHDTEYKSSIAVFRPDSDDDRTPRI